MALRLRKVKFEEGRVIPYPDYTHNNLMSITVEDNASYLVWVEHDATPMMTSPRLDSDVECSGGQA